MNILVASIVTLGVIGCVSAIVLYLVAKKFKVEEDPRIDQVAGVLPGANCGGCGYPGCRGFADACVKADSLDGKLCPVGGQPVMAKVADILGLTVGEATPKVAVVRCNGTCSARPRTSNFDGSKSCAVAVQLYGGETGCSFGCLGYGDCTDACPFDAIHINPATGLPEVDDDKCTACGACVKACPKHVIELRDKGPKNRRVFVSCINRDKGAVARKACSSACIGCGKCAKTCPFDAITVENNLAYIDFEKCRLCRKCVAECPTGAIHDVNFPTPAPAAEKKPVASAASKPAAPAAEKPAPAAEKQVSAIVEEKISPVVAEEKPASTPEPANAKEEIVIETTVGVAEPMPTEPAPAAEKPEKAEQPETAAAHDNTDTPDKKEPQTKSIDPLSDDFDVNSLIPDELRVKPREKTKETKPEVQPKKDDNLLSIDF